MMAFLERMNIENRMSYSIRIVRETAISLEEWKSAVQARSDVRLQQERTSIRNPQTGEEISIGFTDGDAEVWTQGSWEPCFLWRNSGEVVFGAPHDFDGPDSTIRGIARELARTLGGRLVGEEDEEYQ